MQPAFSQGLLLALEMNGRCMVGEPDSAMLIQKQYWFSKQIENSLQSVTYGEGVFLVWETYMIKRQECFGKQNCLSRGTDKHQIPYSVT